MDQSRRGLRSAGRGFCRDLLKLSRDARDLVLVRSTLKSWEDSLIDLRPEAACVLAVENHAGARAAERLVGGGGDNIADLERIGRFLRRNQTRDVGLGVRTAGGSRWSAR